MVDPPVIKNAGRLVSEHEAILANGWMFILAGLALGLAWYGLKRALKAAGLRVRI